MVQINRKIIGICGFIGSGKDTIADYLVTHYHFIKLSFAGCLKDVLSVLFGWNRNQLEGSTSESRIWREKVDEWWSKRLNIPNFTPRHALQYFGTDIFRKHFHNDIWIAAIERKILNYPNQNIVITDCRFLNETSLIQQLNGEVWNVTRTIPDWFELALKASNGNIDAIQQLKQQNIHPSEYNCLSCKFDVIIQNKTSLQDLFQKVDQLLQ